MKGEGRTSPDFSCLGLDKGKDLSTIITNVRMNELAMGHNTRETILLVAEEFFAKQGYAATSIRQIAQKAEIAIATIYNHFSSKEEIILCLVKEAHQQLVRDLGRAKENQNLREMIKKAAEAQIQFSRRKGYLFRIMAREWLHTKGPARDYFKKFHQEYSSFFRQIIEKGINKGFLRRVDPDLASHLLIGMIRSLFAREIFRGKSRRSPEELAEELTNIFLEGIRKHDFQEYRALDNQ